MQSTFAFGSHSIHVPPPPYPPGAAAFEHQRSMGIDVLQPNAAADAASSGLNAAFMPGMTAYKVWPCSQQLGEWLHCNDAPSLGGCNVIELGAGCGLSGFAARLAGASNVCLSDLEENLPRLRELVALNKASAVSVHALDWTAALPPALASTRWDVILAADCVFWPALFEPLLQSIAALSAAGGAPADGRRPRAFLAMTDRLGRIQQFAAVAREAGYVLSRLKSASEAAAATRPLPANSLDAMRRDACELYELVRA